MEEQTKKNHCAKCGRVLKNAHVRNGESLGRVCAKKVEALDAIDREHLAHRAALEMMWSSASALYEGVCMYHEKFGASRRMELVAKNLENALALLASHINCGEQEN